MREQAYVVGRWIDVDDDSYIAVDDPATEAVIGYVPHLPGHYLDGGIDAVSHAFMQWRRMSVVERADRLLAWYAGMQAHADALARLMTWEQGKPITEARAEVDYAASFIRWFAEEARRTTGVTIPPED